MVPITLSISSTLVGAGNLSFESEALMPSSLALALAAKAAGRLVIAQGGVLSSVRRLVRNSAIACQ
jgi:acyl CoA:acetate/3-ketoacid CoA transferase